LKIVGLTLIAVKVREPPGGECLGRASVGYAYLLINCPLGVRSETSFFGERGEKWSIHLVTLPAGHTDKETHKIDTHDQKEYSFRSGEIFRNALRNRREIEMSGEPALFQNLPGVATDRDYPSLFDGVVAVEREHM
jgi:hypothetical protein